MTPKLAAIEQALGRLGATSKSTGASVGQMAGGFALGTIAANAITGAISNTVGAFMAAGKGALDLSSRLEQAKIGFTTMLGSAQKADQFIGALQTKAESTAFSFPGLQQVAQSFLAMGISANNVIPIIDDVSNALSAAGHGGDTDALQRVGQSLSEVAAQGKITAEQLRELSRNGIAVLPMLAAAFGKTTAEVRKMAEAGEISANMFFEAFHSQVAQRYGDIQAQQAKTWAVAVSNLGDILGRLSTQTLQEFFDALTQGALALNDFLHSDRVLQWAADFKASIHEVLVALGPLGAALQAALGGGGAAPVAAGPVLGPSPAEVAKAMTVPPAAIKSAADYAAQIKAAEADIHDTTAALTALSAQQDALKNQIADVTKTWDLRLTGLKDQQEANNAAIEATKTKYEALLDPLQRQSAALQRLGEDTKAAFAKILDPLKAQLDAVNTKIADTKTAYEAATRPIQAQIDAINRANNALKTQRDLVVKIADISLREKQLASLGDPALRASIASQMKALEIADEYLNIQKDQLDLGNKKGNNDKAIANVQSQLDANRSKELALQKQLLDAANNPLKAQIAGQEVLNSAQAEALKIAQDKADLEAAAKTRPLEEQLAAAKAQLQTLLDPLEAQAAALEKMIKSVSATEAAALAPIEAAQTSVARAIADTNQAMQDALKPLEDASKAIAAQITAAEAGKAKALAPLKAELDDLDRKSNALDLHKRQQADIVQGAKDAAAAMKDEADQAAKVAAALDLSGGKGADFPVLPGGLEGPVAPKVGKSLIPPETIQSWKDLAANVQAAADAFDHLNVSTSGGLTAGIIAGGKFLAVFATAGLIASKIEAIGAALTGAGLAATLTQTFWAAWAIFVVGSIETVRKEWDATDWAAIGDDWNNAIKGMQTTLDTFGSNLGTGIAKWLREAKTAQDAQLAIWGDAWNTYWNTTFPAQMKTFWETTFPNTVKAGFETALGLMPGSVDKMLHAFDPLVKLFTWISEHWPGRNQPAVILPGGSGNLQTSLRSGGASGGMGGGGEIEQYIRQSASLRNIDENIAVLVAKSEGGLLDPTRQSDVVYGGRRERSFGPFQLNIDGGLGATAIASGIDPRNEAQWKQAVDFALDQVSRGGWEPFHGAAGSGIGNWEGVGSPGAAAGAAVMARLNAPSGTAGRSQYALTEQGLSADEAAAACGPYAAMLFANAVGRYPTAQETIALAQKVGWTPGQGMAGIDSQLALLSSMGLNAVKQAGTAGNINAALGAGKPIQLSTAGHYFEASGGTAEGGLNVGSTGTALKGGKPVMTLAEIEALSGPLQGIIVLQDALNTSQDAGAQAAAAQAAAQAGLARIMSGGVGATSALGAAQKQATDWAKVFADQEAALNATLAQQVPPGRAAADAMAQLGSVLGPVERQIAAGSISADTLRGTLLDLAKATGLADQPWQDFATGAADANAAMDELIGITATLGPEFQAVADYQQTAGASSNEAALRWLQAAKAYAAAKDALAAAPAVPPVPTATANSVDVVSANWVDVKAKQDAAAESLKNYQTVVQGLDPGKINEQTDAWGKETDAVDRLSDGLHKLASFLDDHTFHVQVKVDDIPDWARPGSPTPFEMGLRGIKRAADQLKPISLMSDSQPLLSPASRSAAFSGGGGGSINVGEIHVNGMNDPKAAAREIRDELVKLGRRNGGGSRVLS